MLLFVLIGLLGVVSCQDPYMEEIQRLKELVNSGRSRPSRASHKPKKYKCFLVDEDDFTFSDYAAAKAAHETTADLENYWASKDQEVGLHISYKIRFS